MFFNRKLAFSGLCFLQIDFSDRYLSFTVRFRSIEPCAMKSRTNLASESPAPEGAASASEWRDLHFPGYER